MHDNLRRIKTGLNESRNSRHRQNGKNVRTSVLGSRIWC